jgi:hypothetical protein
VSNEPKSIGDILDRLEETAGGASKVSFGQIVESLGHRSQGPFLIVPALLEISPIGSIPGVPTVLAAIVILFAAQIMFGRKHVWLPQFVASRGLSAEKIRKGVEKLRPIAERVDRWFHGRVAWLTGKPFVSIAAAACILLALSVPPLEILPFASTAPMAAIAAFGLALLVRDGVLMIAAGLLAALAVAFSLGIVSWTL